MTISTELNRDAVALGRYRLLFWDYSQRKYLIPSFEVFDGIRLPYTATHSCSFDSVRMARYFVLCNCPSACVIIAPY